MCVWCFGCAVRLCASALCAALGVLLSALLLHWSSRLSDCDPSLVHCFRLEFFLCPLPASVSVLFAVLYCFFPCCLTFPVLPSCCSRLCRSWMWCCHRSGSLLLVLSCAVLAFVVFSLCLFSVLEDLRDVPHSARGLGRAQPNPD